MTKQDDYHRFLEAVGHAQPVTCWCRCGNVYLSRVVKTESKEAPFKSVSPCSSCSRQDALLKVGIR